MQDQAIDLLKEVRADVKTILEVQARHDERIKDVIGNGKLGRLPNVERKVEDIDKLKYKVIGYGLGVLAAMEVMHALFSAGLGTIIHK